MFDKYELFVANSLGSVSRLNFDAKTFTISSMNCVKTRIEITLLRGTSEWDEIVFGNAKGGVYVWNGPKDHLTKLDNSVAGIDPVVGIAVVDDGGFVCSCHSGAFTLCQRGAKAELLMRHAGRGTVDAMQQDMSNPHLIAFGGVNNEIRLYDLERKTFVWLSKNVRHDVLDLPVPISVRGITFLQEGNGNLLTTVTKEGRLRMYDIKAQRKPVVDYTPEKQTSYTTVVATSRERQCLVGTTRGHMQLMDFRAKNKFVRQYDDFAGSVTGISSAVDIDPFIASTSLDRHLRIHDMDEKVLILREYRRARLCAVLMRPLHDSK